jgi:hypothetical protein
MDAHGWGGAVSARQSFDIDAIMRDVSTAAKRRAPATSATLLQNSRNRSNVAVVASQPVPEIEERAALAADSVPAIYLDTWAGLNCQRPGGVTEGDWLRALDDGGRFLDGLGEKAAEIGWSPSELFDVGRGLVWNLRGESVLAIGTHGVCLSNGLMLHRRG